MWQLADKSVRSRLLLGTANYPSPATLLDAINAANADVVTVSLRRHNVNAGSSDAFVALLRQANVAFLPNTAGCQTASEAIVTAQMTRELFNTRWIKLEVTGNDYTLQPDPVALIEAARELCQQGFEVFPYCTDDLVIAEKLVEAGCRIVMPWGSPIGSGKGLMNPYTLRLLRQHFPELTLIIDAGIGAPSQAAQAMEWGYDGVLLNTAVAEASDPVGMARAFAGAVEAGHLAYQSGLIEQRDMAKASTPLVGKPFWHQQG